MDIPISYKRYLDCSRKLFTDSRHPTRDGIFVALHGPHFDGNIYAMEAIEKGAAYAIVDRKVYNDPRLILVENTLQELQKMGSINRRLNRATVIAITGSNGKTTTKELCYGIFNSRYSTIATSGNLNNHIGVPLTLLRITETTEFAIVEMGANQPGDIDFLCRIADPDAGLITSIGKAHLEGFGSMENIIKTKNELFSYLQHKNGIRFYNLFSNELQALFSKDPHSISYGPEKDKSIYTANLMRSYPDIEMIFWNGKVETKLYSKLFGEYNFQNIVAAASLASYFAIPPAEIANGVAHYVPANMRSQIIEQAGNTLILDAYNANPSSMKYSIEAFEKMDYEYKWIILGEMAEMGTYKEMEHQVLVDLISTKNFEKKILVGPYFLKYQQQKDFIVFGDVKECKEWLNQHWPVGRSIFIKGSRSSKLEQLLDRLEG